MEFFLNVLPNNIVHEYLGYFKYILVYGVQTWEYINLHIEYTDGIFNA